jgi:hypothetical protein
MRRPPEISNRLKQHGRPKPKLGVSDWQERWKRGDYNRLKLWQIAWGLLRHSDEYWYNWAFDIGPRWAEDWSVVVPATDTSEWARRYGLRHAVDPALSAFEILENPFRSASEADQQVYRGPREVNVVLRPNQAMMIIDLSRPIAPQLAAAKRRLPPRSRKSPRLRRNKYPQYVCALDGKAAGASIVALGRVLYPKLAIYLRKDQANNDLRAAQALGWSGYQFIARR